MPRVLIALAALTFTASVAASLAAQETSRPPGDYLRPAVFGEMIDSSTGKPVGRVGWTVEGHIGLGWSRPNGRFLLFDLKPGRHVVSLYCPTTRQLRGRKFAERVIDVSPSTDSLVNFTIPMTGCTEPPERSRTGEFRGHYTPGFESSHFEGCTSLDDLRGTTFEGESQAAWVVFDYEALERVKTRWPDTRNEDYPRLYVRWRATVTGPGSYGHMGGALYGMSVHEVLEIRRAGRSDCR